MEDRDLIELFDNKVRPMSAREWIDRATFAKQSRRHGIVDLGGKSLDSIISTSCILMIHSSTSDPRQETPL